MQKHFKKFSNQVDFEEAARIKTKLDNKLNKVKINEGIEMLSYPVGYSDSEPVTKVVFWLLCLLLTAISISKTIVRLPLKIYLDVRQEYREFFEAMKKW